MYYFVQLLLDSQLAPSSPQQRNFKFLFTFISIAMQFIYALFYTNVRSAPGNEEKELPQAIELKTVPS